MSSRGKRKSKAPASHATDRWAPSNPAKKAKEDKEPSFVEALYGDAWPIGADRRGGALSDKQTGARKGRVSHDEASARLFEEAPFEGVDDGSRAALLDQSLLCWREDSLFVYDLQSLKFHRPDTDKSDEAVAKNLSGIKKLVCGPRERPLIPTRFRTAGGNKLIQFPPSSAFPPYDSRHLMPKLLSNLMGRHGLTMTQQGKKKYDVFTASPNLVAISSRAVAMRFVNAPPASAAPYFKSLYDARESTFDQYLVAPSNGSAQPSELCITAFACLSQPRSAEIERRLAADAVRFVKGLPRDKSPLTCGSLEGSHAPSKEGGGSSSSGGASTRRMESPQPHGLSSEGIRTLCRRAGVACESADVHEEVRGIALTFVAQMVHDQVAAAQTIVHGAEEGPAIDEGPLVVSCDAVLRSAPSKPTVYGLGSRSGVKHVLSGPILGVLQQVHPGKMMSGPALSIVHDMLVDLMERVLLSAQEAAQKRPCPPSLVRHVPVSHVLAPTSESLQKTFVGNPTELAVTLLHETTEGAPTAEGEAAAAPDDPSTSPCTDKDLVQALRAVISGSPEDNQVLRHAQSECAKALTKFGASKGPDAIGTKGTGLVFPPVLVTRAAIEMWSRRAGDNGKEAAAAAQAALTMTEKGAVGLAAIVEYFCAEVLELAGKRTGQRGPYHHDPKEPEFGTLIDGQHVWLAVSQDDELTQLWDGQMVGFGVLGARVDERLAAMGRKEAAPHAGELRQLELNQQASTDNNALWLSVDGSHMTLPPIDPEELEQELYNYREEKRHESYFNKRDRLAERRHAYIEEYGYDDGPGMHSDSDDGERRFGSDCGSDFEPSADDRDEVIRMLRKEQGDEPMAVPIFDVVSPLTREARKREAYGELSPEEREQLAELRAEPVGAFQRRLAEIKREQEVGGTTAFCPDAFLRLMLEKANELHAPRDADGKAGAGGGGSGSKGPPIVEGRVLFTHEAVVATQAITESHLVAMLRDARTRCLDGGRYVLLPSDLLSATTSLKQLAARALAGTSGLLKQHGYPEEIVAAVETAYATGPSGGGPSGAGPP